MRLLVIEDTERLAQFMRTGLQREGFAVDLCATCDEADAALRTARYDAVVLDLMLPDGDGIDFLKRLRRGGDATPIIIVTARERLQDRVGGLNAGADDYLVKPFALEELVARIRALLRRPGAALGVILRAGNLAFDTVAREATVGGDRVPLSRREAAVLELLLRRSGRVVPKEVIEESLSGYDEELTGNAVEVYVHRLRKRLAECGADVAVHTLRGVGYLLAEAAA
jgi:DNA-binding response OmpR family regulator